MGGRTTGAVHPVPEVDRVAVGLGALGHTFAVVGVVAAEVRNIAETSTTASTTASASTSTMHGGILPDI